TPGRERIRRHRRGRYDGHGLPGCGRAGRTATVSATITADDGVLVPAPGKINLRLRGGPARAAGYHPSATWSQAVRLFEEVRAGTADRVSVTVTGRGADRVSATKDNPAHRAARLLAGATGNSEGADLHITKEV